MAFPTFTFCPEFGAREIREPKTRPFRFGNGKERRYRFGLNNDLRKWELQFDYRNTQQREAILEFLEERNGWKRFTWTDPKGFTGLWRCREWDTTWNGYVQNSIRCTFEEDEQKAAGEVEAPAPADIPDMWASRCVSSLGTKWNLPTAATVCSDGTSYQAAIVELSSNPLNCDLQVIKRSDQGVVVWNKKLEEMMDFNFINNLFPHTLQVYAGPSNEAYISTIADERIKTSSSDVTTSYENRDSLLICVNPDGGLRWQRKIGFSATYRPNGTLDGSIGAQRTDIYSVIYSNASGLLYCAGVVTRSSGGNIPRATAFVISIDPATGATQSVKTFWVSDPDLTGAPATQVEVHERNSRLYLCGGCGASPRRSFFVELSLNLQTVFSSYQWSNARVNMISPSADGGWYALAQDSSGRYRAYKAAGNFQPLWANANATGGRFWAHNTGDGFFAATEQKQAYGISADTTGSPIYSVARDSFNFVPSVKNATADLNQFGASITGAYDHEVNLGAKWATQANLPYGQNTDRTNDIVTRITAYNQELGYAIGFYMATGTFGGFGAAVVDARLAAYGYRVPFEDEGERWMDAGRELNSAFIMTARSQLDGDYGKAVRITNPSELPTSISYDWPETITKDYAISSDPGFGWGDGGLVFNYYSYRDPQFVPPTAEGLSGIAFYSGNNAVQKVSVGALFTPAFLLHANRAGGSGASGTSVVYWGSNLARNQYIRWGHSSIITTSTSDTYLQGTGTGFFRISGRDPAPVSWNLINNNYVAIALAAVAGGFDSVAYTGNGSSSREILHGLGETPEFMFVRTGTATEPAGGSLIGSGNIVNMKSTAARTADSTRIASVSSGGFAVGSNLNFNGITYYAYLFRSCDGWDIGTYAGDGGGAVTVSLGYRPKAVMVKTIIGGTSNWELFYREDGGLGSCQFMSLNTGNGEGTNVAFSLTADGFSVDPGGIGNTGGVTALYWALK
jgi:phage-related protein